MVDYAEEGKRADENLAQYDSNLEVYRKEKDIMYKLMDGTEIETLWHHLNGVIENIKEEYGKDLSGMRNTIAYTKQRDAHAMESVGGPSLEKILEILEWIRDSEDVNIMMALWFFSVYSRPSITRWLETAPLNDKKQFDIFRDRILAPESEKLIGGHGPSIDDYVRFLRAEYINRCGLPIPTPEEQFTMLINSQGTTL